MAPDYMNIPDEVRLALHPKFGHALSMEAESVVGYIPISDKMGLIPIAYKNSHGFYVFSNGHVYYLWNWSVVVPEWCNFFDQFQIRCVDGHTLMLKFLDDVFLAILVWGSWESVEGTKWHIDGDVTNGVSVDRDDYSYYEFDSGIWKLKSY